MWLENKGDDTVEISERFPDGIRSVYLTEGQLFGSWVFEGSRPGFVIFSEYMPVYCTRDKRWEAVPDDQVFDFLGITNFSDFYDHASFA